MPPVPAGGGGGGGSTSRRWLVTDHIGNGTVWLDSGGERVRHTEFAPFGRVYPGAQVASGAVAAPGIYAGHQREIASGLDYMQARWYDSATGTFLSVDPLVADVEDPQSHNAYSYARNNPILYTDPTGEIFSPFFNALAGFAFLPAIAGFGSEPGFIGGSLVPGAAGSSILNDVISSPNGPIQDSDENVIFPGGAGPGADQREDSSGFLIVFGEQDTGESQPGPQVIAQMDPISDRIGVDGGAPSRTMETDIEDAVDQQLRRLRQAESSEQVADVLDKAGFVAEAAGTAPPVLLPMHPVLRGALKGAGIAAGAAADTKKANARIEKQKAREMLDHLDRF